MLERETWSSNLGFVLACVGAALGLGNIWMFPWRLGEFGGAAFLIIYLFFIVVLGTSGLMEEFAFGRSQRKGAISSFEQVFKTKDLPFGSLVGTIPVLGVTGVFIFYTVVMGWIFKYFSLSILGAFNKMQKFPAFFGGFTGTKETIIWHLIAVVLTLLIVRLGVKDGIEKVNKYMMPTLFVLLIILMIRSLTLSGAGEGLKFMFIPEWSVLLDPTTWVMALGQAFFTVSLGGAAMLVYGSYLDEQADIPSSAFKTVIFNTLSSLLAALVIIPAAFAFNLDPQAGPPLLFITIPNIFKMMPGGYIFGILFFLSIVFAAISSAINLMEVPVEALIDRFDIKRKKSVFLVGTLGFIAGIPLDLNMSMFGTFVDIVTIYLIPGGAVLAAITFFWIFGVSKAREEINKGTNYPIGKWWEPFAKYIFSAIAIIVWVLNIIYGGIG